MTSSRMRWAVPVAVAAVVAGAAALGATSATAGPVDLPPRTAAELLTDLATAAPQPLTGTVTETAALGLPALPESSTGTLGPLTLATGTHTLRVATDGAGASRAALVGSLAEYDVVRSGTDLWTWSSETATATHTTLPAGDDTPRVLPTTPAEAAAAVLARIDPTTEVGVDDAVVVAGRAARQLVLVPRDAGTLVGSVRVAVDAETSAPLQVQVVARGASTPALEVGFTDVTFAAPDPALLTFTPPPGAKVTELAAPTGGGDRPDGPAPTTTGSGWSTITELRGPAASGLGTDQRSTALLDQLTTRVPQGRVLSTALLSVLLTDDGRVLVGAVPADALVAAA